VTRAREALQAAARTSTTYLAGFLPGVAPRRFLIVCPPRSGSELLVGLLDSHPQIRCEGEIYKNVYSAPLRYAAGRAAVATARGASAWGCKVLDQQILWSPKQFGPMDRFLETARDRGFTLVHLTRRDLVAQAASVMHAPTARYHYHEGDGESFEPFTVDVAELIATIHLLDQHSSELEHGLADLDAIRLVYEDDLLTPEDQQVAVDRVCAALGLEKASVRSTLRSAAPTSARDRFSNWQAVEAALSLTRFDRFVTAG
jgi:LPS sulfotransferase NodH